MRQHSRVARVGGLSLIVVAMGCGVMRCSDEEPTTPGDDLTAVDSAHQDGDLQFGDALVDLIDTDDDGASDVTAEMPPHSDMWEQTNGPGGGPISVIEMDPNDPDIIYAGGMGGGIFRTTDGGESWTLPAQFTDPAHPVHDIVIDFEDSQTIYTLVAEQGLYKSADGGESWDVFDREELGVVSAVGMSPVDSSVLIVGTHGGRVSVTDNGGADWTEVSRPDPDEVTIHRVAAGAESEYWVVTHKGGHGALYRSTDGGASWDEMEILRSAETEFDDILIVPDDIETIYVSLTSMANQGGDQGEPYLFRSDNGGDSWTPLMIPSWSSMLGILCYDQTHGALYVSPGNRIYRSVDQGQNWSVIDLPTDFLIVDPADMAVDPRDNQILYVPTRTVGVARTTDEGQNWQRVNEGMLATRVFLLAVPDVPGSGTVYANGGAALFRTTDWGQSWTQIDGGALDHPFFDDIAVSPHDPETVWIITDVAHIFESEDGGTNWEMMVNARGGGSGFRFGSVYALAPSPTDADTIWALKAGFGIFRTVYNRDGWFFARHSEVDYSYALAVHPENPDVVVSGYNPKPFQDFAMIRQTMDGGESWRTSLEIEGSTGVTSVVFDPQHPDTIYAASASTEGGAIWVSHDNGDSWSSLEGLDFTNIHTMTASTVDPNRAVAAIWGGRTFLTDDRGESWVELPNAPTISASAVLLDANDANVMVLADRTSPRIYRTDNAGSGWDWETLFDAGDDYYRVLTAAIAPSQPTVIYASVFRRNQGPVSGDLFRIADGTGTNITGTLPMMPAALAVDPQDADTVYASLHGADGGVYRTTDGGDTWTEISAPTSGLPQSPAVGFLGLVVDPSDTDTIYLLGGSDASFGPSGITSTGADPADMLTVYRSVDGGNTWTNLNDGNLGANSSAIKGLAISPGDSDVLFLGTLNGVFQSTDGGVSWSDISSGLGFVQTAGVWLNSDGSRIYAPTLGGGMYVGDVDSVTHEVVWQTESTLHATIHQVQIAVDPSDSNTLYASAYPGGMFKSVDAGETWTEQNFAMPSFAVDDPLRQGYYAFAIAPSNPDVLYLGAYSVGILRSTDGAQSWLPTYMTDPAMRGKTITSLLIDPDDEDTVFVATENGVFRTVDGGSSWASFDDGLDTTDVRVLAMDANGELLAGTRGYEVYQSSSHTADWEQMVGFDEWGVFWPIWNDRPLYQYTDILFHPTDPNIIYAGTFPSGIFKSTDGGATWREHNVGWTNDGVFSLAFHPNDPEIVYAGTYNGLNRTVDGGLHWEMWDEGWPAEQWVFSIDFDPRDPDVMVACSKNGQDEGSGSEEFRGTVMKSTDGGETWFAITDNLDVHQEFYSIIIDPNDPDTYYLATEADGVYVSTNGGEYWLPFNDGLTNPRAGTNGNNVAEVMVLSADGQFLYFGSAGSGVFRRRIGP